MSRVQIQNQVLYSLRKVQAALSWNQSQLREHLQLTEREYLRVFSKKQGLPIYSLASLAESLNLQLDSFLGDSIDYKALARHYSGDLKYVPEKYSKAAFSKVRSLSTYLDFIEKKHSFLLRQVLIKDFQLNETLVSDPEVKINLQLFKDLTANLRGRGFSKNDIFRIGQHSLEMNREGQLGERLKNFSDPMSALEFFFYEMLSYIEQNCRYEIVRISDHVCVMDCFESKDIANEIRVSHIGSSNVCAFKAGFFSSFPGYFNRPFGTVRELDCVHSGGQKCRFEIDFSPAYHTVNKEFFPFSHRRYH